MKRVMFAFLIVVAGSAFAQAPEHEVRKLADGVYALVWLPQPHSEPNSLIIINDSDVVVVDSGMLPSSARVVASEIQKLTPNPVRYVVNTHWHGDHIYGNFVYRELWPGVECIAHPNTRIDAAAQGFAKIPQYVKDNAQTLEVYRKILKDGKRPDGSIVDAAARKRGERTLWMLEHYDKEIPTVKTMLPNVLVGDALVLHRGARTIEVRYLGLGNTRGDLVVWLPNEKIVATGDLVVWPTPYGFGSYYKDWDATLEKLAQLGATTLVLGHGEIQRDFTYVRTLQALLRDMVSRVAAEVASGASLEDVQKNVTLADWKQKLAGDDIPRQRSFDAFWVAPAVERAYRQAKGEPDSQEVVVR
ncbi:MAG TPA: MBL fold metallo-hydrolase [Thermoanaerobaculia bacterium]|nr:MBL fold metallo-hydrolase [Thermoanaerobaculia bacterium]